MVLRSGQGVMLVGHGTVSDTSELREFLTRIRGGRPFSEHLLEDLCQRYRAVGGSPLLSTTLAQAELLGCRLQAPVVVGTRFAVPTLEAALADAWGLGVRELCVLPVAPFSVHIYAGVVQQILDAHRHSEPWGGLELLPVPPWGCDPRLVRAHAKRIDAARANAPPNSRLVMTAHSLPLAVVARGDPYPQLVEASVRAIAEALGCPFELCYQSQGADGGDWLGPGLGDLLSRLRDSGVSSVLVAPVGFLADHIETLYDLDIEAAQRASTLGLGFTRVPALNTDAGLIEAMAHVVEETLVGGVTRTPD